LNLADSSELARSAGATRSSTWGPDSLRFAAVDVIQAASQVSRLIHEARDLNLSVEPGVRDGRNARVHKVVLLEG
jgi:hypothetical protein